MPAFGRTALRAYEIPLVGLNSFVPKEQNGRLRLISPLRGFAPAGRHTPLASGGGRLRLRA